MAVVTGAGSGTGLALAHRFVDAGMDVVLADVERGPLASAQAALRARGRGRVLAVHTDVRSEAAVMRLADATFSTPC